MRFCAVVLAGALFAQGCGSSTYEIRGGELARLAQLPPEQRAQRVRVTENLTDTDVGDPQPVTSETEILIFPEPNVYGPERRRYYHYGNYSEGGGGINGGGGDWNHGVAAHPPHASVKGGGGGGGGGGGHISGGGGSGKGEAIMLLVAAAVILVAAAAVEGSRYDGYAQLHPMTPVHLFGKDGSYTVMPLAWIDPQTAAWADHALVRTTETPFTPLGRAPLDRVGFTYALMGGVGSYKSVDGTVSTGPASAIQLGLFPDQRIGLVGTLFLGWRDNTYGGTLFESRYTAEVHAYPVQTGPIHLGLFGGGGLAHRWEDLPGGTGDDQTMALVGGALLQLDINTRLAITGRFGATYAHAEQMTDAMIGLSVY